MATASIGGLTKPVTPEEIRRRSIRCRKRTVADIWSKLCDVWAWLHKAEIREWLTLLFAAIAAVVPWTVHQRSVRKTRDEEAANWSIDKVTHFNLGNGFTCHDLRLESAERNRLHLVSLTAKSPRGARITGTMNHGGWEPTYAPDPPIPVRCFPVNRNLNREAHFTSRTSVHQSYSRQRFALFMPQKPFLSLSGPTVRAVIVATVEEISANRRRSRITIRTPPIEWTDSKKPKAP